MSVCSYRLSVVSAVALTLGLESQVFSQQLAMQNQLATENEESSSLQEIVVTAQKREQRLQDVPIAITALSAQDLQARGVTDFTGIAQSSTSMNFTPYPSSSDELILYMRGQGVADPQQITQESYLTIERLAAQASVQAAAESDELLVV